MYELTGFMYFSVRGMWMVSAEKNEKDFPTEWKNCALGIAIAHAQLTYRIEAKVERVLAASVDDANALELTRLHA